MESQTIPMYNTETIDGKKYLSVQSGSLYSSPLFQIDESKDSGQHIWVDPFGKEQITTWQRLENGLFNIKFPDDYPLNALYWGVKPNKASREAEADPKS